MIKVGLCGWTISQREYFERFPVVEVQQTFYQPPPQTTLRRWRATAPPSFEFTLKAWQLITHDSRSSTYKRLRRELTADEKEQVGSFRWTDAVRAAWKTTVECAETLRATAVLFQCPASFRPTDENFERMRVFFRETERHGLRFLWEPRGPLWKAEHVLPLCRELDLVHVVDPFVHTSVTPELIYWRLHGTTGARHIYSDAELRQVIDMLPTAGDAYVMFNNMPRDGDSERFVNMLARRSRG
jgi:uncharacterized protein YecE (DUF72 family)